LPLAAKPANRFLRFAVSALYFNTVTGWVSLSAADVFILIGLELHIGTGKKYAVDIRKSYQFDFKG
jgi:hypothetical protein